MAKEYRATIGVSSLFTSSKESEIIRIERDNLLEQAKKDYPNSKVSRIFETVVKNTVSARRETGIKYFVNLKVKVYDTQSGKRIKAVPSVTEETTTV